MEIFNELSEFISLRMKSCRSYAPGGDWIEHKAHADYDLWLVQSGTVKVQIAGIEHTAHPGDAVFFYPRVPYIASCGGEGCRFIYVHFDYGIGEQQQILGDFQLSGIINGELIREDADRFVQAFAQSEQRSGRPGNRLYLKACLTAVVAKIIERHGQGQYSGAFLDATSPRRSDRDLDVLQPIFRYIEDHLHTSIRMNQLAPLAGISEKYFISYFKKAVGITPGQYVYQIKMNRARDYLYEKKYTVQQVAGFLGYPDPFTFSKAFKKYYNVPPSKFD
ncbi:AraC family transcriptional regulator [Cohnella sp. JJ-181]|uniref:AraC family transcriptional regulator n=1 Tax=Cohnella rhizoplanae TaxID=2974897 RepID=UPI00233117D3|nr:AraC family transcriptional regulator [Cohnella sp. JJ-181]